MALRITPTAKLVPEIATPLNAIRFAIFGTRIRKGEQIWLTIEQRAGNVSKTAKAYTTLQDAINDALAHVGGVPGYIQRLKKMYRDEVPPGPRMVRKGSRMEFVETSLEGWLEQEGYPTVLTEEGIYRFVEKYNYLYVECSTFGLGTVCETFFRLVTIE